MIAIIQYGYCIAGQGEHITQAFDDAKEWGRPNIFRQTDDGRMFYRDEDQGLGDETEINDLSWDAKPVHGKLYWTDDPKVIEEHDQ